MIVKYKLYLIHTHIVDTYTYMYQVPIGNYKYR